MDLIGVEHSPVVNHLADGAASSQQLVVSLQEARAAVARLEVMVAAGAAVAVMEAPIRESG